MAHLINMNCMSENYIVGKIAKYDQKSFFSFSDLIENVHINNYVFNITDTCILRCHFKAKYMVCNTTHNTHSLNFHTVTAAV